MEKLIRPSGNYRKLLSYQKTEVIYEMTYFFCQRFLQHGDRTVDQMVQAARSGKQNIIEGCSANWSVWKPTSWRKAASPNA